ncbi:MAG: hypothetical protein IJC74_04395 [Clostridia bacterium]|nr:hypothetical protein [Clostridia bacterium]
MTYILLAICIAAVFLIRKYTRIFTPYTFYASIVFILLSLLLGKAFHFYEIIPFWDLLLHFISGFITAPIGKQAYFNLKGDVKNLRLMLTFTLLFAVTLAAGWEIYEFAIDSLLNTNAQNGSLSDTMWDIIAGSVSGVIYVIVLTKQKIDSNPL